MKVKNLIATIGVVLWGLVPAVGQDLQALARVDPSQSEISDRPNNGVAIELALSQPVPFRVFALDDPKRIVVDFKEVDWSGLDGATILKSENVSGLRFGIFRPGWSRMVLDLKDAQIVHSAEMKVNKTRGTGRLEIVLVPALPDAFAKAALVREKDGWAVPKTSVVPSKSKERQLGDRPLVVVLDPGHGGVDPGAERGGYVEKDLVLQFARELKDSLIRSGRYRAELTRPQDSFLSLPDRITRARSLGADVFISLHADALAEGSATGTTVYTLSGKASDSAAQQLAEQHDRGDLLAGVDLREQDDQIASVLMDMARLETAVRSDLLAGMMVNGIAQSIGRIRKRPHLSAGFTVLKAPDIPSILIELGFMSNKSDLNNLLTYDWREKVIRGMVLALDTWVVEDAAQARLLRQ